VIDGLDYVNGWPIVIIVVGLAKLSHRRPDGRREGGCPAWARVGG